MSIFFAKAHHSYLVERDTVDRVHIPNEKSLTMQFQVRQVVLVSSCQQIYREVDTGVHTLRSYGRLVEVDLIRVDPLHEGQPDFFSQVCEL